jgi:hypothetical protein
MRMPLIRTTIGLLTRLPLLLWQLDENELSVCSRSLQIYIHIVLTTITRRRKRNA